jgi:hypothetical protein
LALDEGGLFNSAKEEFAALTVRESEISRLPLRAVRPNAQIVDGAWRIAENKTVRKRLTRAFFRQASLFEHPLAGRS